MLVADETHDFHDFHGFTSPAGVAVLAELERRLPAGQVVIILDR